MTKSSTICWELTFVQYIPVLASSLRRIFAALRSKSPSTTAESSDKTQKNTPAQKDDDILNQMITFPLQLF